MVTSIDRLNEPHARIENTKYQPVTYSAFEEPNQ